MVRLIFDEKLEYRDIRRKTYPIKLVTSIRADNYNALEEMEKHLNDFSETSTNQQDLINWAIYFLVESLKNAKCDDQRLAILLDLEDRYNDKAVRHWKQ